MPERTRPADKRHPTTPAQSPTSDLLTALAAMASEEGGADDVVMIQKAAQLAPFRVAVDGLLGPIRCTSEEGAGDSFWESVQVVADAGRALRDHGDNEPIQELLGALNKIPMTEGRVVENAVLSSWMDLTAAAYYLGVATALRCTGGVR